MKKLILVLLVFICNLAPTSLKAQKFTGSLLWEISGNGLKKPSYVYGTHHLIASEFLDSVPQLWNSFNKCEQIVGEINIDELSTLPQLLQSQILLSENESYLDFLSPEEYATFDTLLVNNLGAGLEQAFGRYKPAIISLTLTQMMAAEIMELDMKTHKPVDFILQEKGLQDNKLSFGLETAQEQLNVLLGTLTDHEQVMAIICALENKKALLDELIQMNESYKNADLVAFESWNADSPCPVSDDFEVAINKQRNDLWMEKLPAIIKENSSFIAVGCLHLVGEDGLLNQFEKLGYTVKAVQ